MTNLSESMLILTRMFNDMMKVHLGVTGNVDMPNCVSGFFRTTMKLYATEEEDVRRRYTQ